MGLIPAAFLLRNLESALNSLAPEDKVAFIVKGTNSGSALSVDLSKAVRKGAEVSYFQFKRTTTNSSTGLLSSAAAVAGASADVLVLVICDKQDIADVSQL